MFSLQRKEMILKMISAIVAGIFFFHEVAWAAIDPYGVPTGSGNQLAPSVTTDNITASESAAQSAVDSKKAIESFSVPKSPQTQKLTDLPGTKTYYSSGRVQSILLAASDTDGNLYYHFLDENWLYRGYGRVDKSYRDTAAPDGELSDTYIYFSDASGRLKTKRSYTDKNWTNALADTAYYNNSYNRKDTKIYIGSQFDPLTGLYYCHFANNTMNRLDKGIRRTGINGELSYTYTYYSASTAYLSTVKSYSDAGWRSLVATYTYYNNAGSYVESKTSAAADIYGNIYYHYINENWLGQGFGRVDKAKRSTADNGELSYSYTYYADATGRLKTRMAYINTSWTTLIRTYTYYNDVTGYTEFITSVSPDTSGYIYYHLMNENWNSQGGGRVDKAQRLTATANGALSYIYTYYGDTAGRVESIKAYRGAAGTGLLRTYIYFNDTAGRVSSIADSVSAVTYYNDASNWMESKTLVSPDASGNIYYHYINENWNSEGYGRVDMTKRQSADIDGYMAYKYFYSAATPARVIRLEFYSDTALTQLKQTANYYDDTANRIESRSYTSADTRGYLYYHYLNNSASSLDIAKRSASDSSGCIATKYHFSSVTPSRMIKLESYADAAMTQLTLTNTYYDDATNYRESMALAAPDAGGAVFYHYMNDANARCDYAMRQAADTDGYMAYKYFYSGTTPTRVIRREFYLDAAMTMLKETAAYYDDTASRIASRTYIPADTRGYVYYHYLNNSASSLDIVIRSAPDTSGCIATRFYYSSLAPSRMIKLEDYADTAMTQFKLTNTYYDDAANYRESMALALPDASGNIYYRYLNENWLGQGMGRVEKEKRAAARGGELSSQYTYNADTFGRVLTKQVYSDGDCTVLVKTYSYYNDMDGRIQSVSDAASGTIETYYNDAATYLTQKTMSDGSYVIYSYHDGTDKVSLEKLYLRNGKLYSDTEYNASGKMSGYTDYSLGRVCEFDLYGNIVSDTVSNRLQGLYEYTYDNGAMISSVYLDAVSGVVTVTDHYNEALGLVKSYRYAPGAIVDGGISYLLEDLSSPYITASYTTEEDIIVGTEHVTGPGAVEYYVISRYNKNGQVVSRTGKLLSGEADNAETVAGSTAAYTYDSNGDILSELGPGAEEPFVYEYDKNADGAVMEKRFLDIKKSRMTLERYDSSGRLTESFNVPSHYLDGPTGPVIVRDGSPETPIITCAYSTSTLPGGFIAEKRVKDKDASGNDVDFTEITEYDAKKRVISHTDPYGNTVNYVYNSDGSLSSESDTYSGSEVTTLITYAYSTSGNVDEIIKTTNVYATGADKSAGNPVKAVIEHDRITRDEYLRVTKEIKYTEIAGSEDPITFYETLYAIDGNVTEENERTASGPGSVTSYKYNGRGGVSEIDYPSGKKDAYLYVRDNIGRLRSETVITSEADIVGSVYTTSVTTVFDPATGDTLSYTDSSGNVTAYSYSRDAKGGLLSEKETVTGSNGTFLGSKETIYDKDGREISITVNKGMADEERTDFSYDSDGAMISRAITRLDAGGKEEVTSESYGADGLLAMVTEPSGVMTEYSYLKDKTGAITLKTVTEKTKTVDGTKTVTVKKYDAKGYLVYDEDTEKGLIKEMVPSYENQGTPLEYLREERSILTQRAEGAPPVMITTSKKFNDRGQLIEIGDGARPGMGYSYYGADSSSGHIGDLAAQIDPAGIRIDYTYTYDTTGGHIISKKSVYSEKDSTGVYRVNYALDHGYDILGRVTLETDKYGVKRTYTYEPLDVEPSTVTTETVSYTDKDGNAVSSTVVMKYSPDGKTLIETDRPDGTVTYYDHTGADPLVLTGERILRPGGGGGILLKEVTYRYDDTTGRIKESIATDTRGTDNVSDDIVKVTSYDISNTGKNIKETSVYAPGVYSPDGKAQVREIYHYKTSGALDRVETMGLSGTTYKTDIESFYAVYNGKVLVKTRTTGEGREDFNYDGDGNLTDSVFTSGLYSARTEKRYAANGDVINVTMKGMDGDTVTDITYVRNAIGNITGKTETVRYRPYNLAGGNTDTILAVKSYTYYGSEDSDKAIYPEATASGAVKTMTSGGKTYSYEYTYDAEGVLTITKETVSWDEGASRYTAVSLKKSDTKGDIIASIDTEGVYSEYEYSTDAENAMGGKVQTEKSYYGLIDAKDPSKGYTRYRRSSFDGSLPEGLSESRTVRVYDFDNDLVSLTEANDPANVSDDIVTRYTYVKDELGRVKAGYETVNGRAGVKVSEYDEKGDLVSETDRNGMKVTYSYERDGVLGYIKKTVAGNVLYPGFSQTTGYDTRGDVISVTGSNGIRKTYTFIRDASGKITARKEDTTSSAALSGSGILMNYTETSEYDANGDITGFTDKNGIKRTTRYIYDRYGNEAKTITEVIFVSGTSGKITVTDYNPDGTESRVTEMNDPASSEDDITRTYSYKYDQITGVLSEKTETDIRYSGVTVYRYDNSGDVTIVVSPNGVTLSYAVKKDDKGGTIERYTKTSLSPDAVEKEEFDTEGNRISLTDANGHIATYLNTYDGKSDLIKATEYRTGPSGLYTSVVNEYDSFGRIKLSVDKNGTPSAYEYSVTPWGAVTSSREYDPRGTVGGGYDGSVLRVFDAVTSDLISMTDRLGLTTVYEYGRSPEHGGITLKTERAPLGGTTVYGMDKYGRIISVTDTYDKTVTVSLEFDTCGNMTKRLLSWQETIDGQGVQDYVEEEYYSIEGDLVKRVDRLKNVYTYIAEKNGKGDLARLVTVDHGRNNDKMDISSVDYDASGRIISRTTPRGDVTYYAYQFGSGGEVKKIYESVAPTGEKIDALKPVEIKNISVRNCYFGVDPWQLVDDKYDNWQNFGWEYSMPTDRTSIILDLTGNGSDQDNVSALGLSFRSPYNYPYTVYYATNEAPDNWIKIKTTDLNTDNDWFIDSFGTPVAARYIRIENANEKYWTTAMQLNEVKVYRTEKVSGTVRVSDLDKYGRAVSEKNALMLLWEERPDLKKLFINPNSQCQLNNYFSGKDVSEWARFTGALEDPRIAGYISDYANRNSPLIKEYFEKGSKGHMVTSVTPVSASWSDNVSYLTDYSVTAGSASIRWDNDTVLPYFRLDLGGLTDIGKFRIKFRDDGNSYKYRIFTSEDGVNWEGATDRTDMLYSGWVEDLISPRKARFVKLEAVYGAASDGKVNRQMNVDELMILDTASDTYPPNGYATDTMLAWAKGSGSRLYADLAKYADNTYPDKDRPSGTMISYENTDSSGIPRSRYEISTYTGAAAKLYDPKGVLTEELLVNESSAVVTPIVYPGSASSLEKVYGAGGDILAERNILGRLWEETVEARDLFLVPGYTYNGMTFKTWVASKGQGYFSLLGNKGSSDINALDDPYIARYAYTRDDTGFVASVSKIVNYVQETYSVYKKPVPGENPLNDMILLDGTKHTSTGGVNPSLDYDGYDTTAYSSESFSPDADVTSTHEFAQPVTLSEIYYNTRVSADSGGRGESYDMNVQYLQAGSSVWVDVARTSGCRAFDVCFSGTWHGTLANVTAIRVRATARAWNGDNNNAYAEIFELSARGPADTGQPVVVQREFKALDATRKKYSYTYHPNGNLAGMDVDVSGKDTKDYYMRYDALGNITLYNEDGRNYSYEYTRDRWNNIEKVKVDGSDTVFMNNGKSWDEEAVVSRVKDYFAAMLYRAPASDELTFCVSEWRKTGYTNFVRDYIKNLTEYKNGPKDTGGQTLALERAARLSGMLTCYNVALSAGAVLTAALSAGISLIKEGYNNAVSAYTAAKGRNDKKYISEIYREELGREATDEELTETLAHMRSNNLTLESEREHIRNASDPASEYAKRRAEITVIINSLYTETEAGTSTGILADYLAASDKPAYLKERGYDIDPSLLVNITKEDIQIIITRLKTQDNHFGQSAAEALYASLQANEAALVIARSEATKQSLSIMNYLLQQLIFVDLITGAITSETQGQLLLTMYALKKVSQKHGLDVYGSKYTFDDFIRQASSLQGADAPSLRGAEGDEAIPIIVHYNGTHFLTVTGVIRDTTGTITHIKVTNSYINNIEQTKQIPLTEFKKNYEGTTLSTARSDYKNRLTDTQLLDIKAAGWWDKLWKKVTQIFEGIVKAVKKIVTNIIQPVVQMINAIKYAAQEGKWGRVAGAIGALVVGSVMSVISGGTLAYPIMNTVTNMATAICYGQYGQAMTIMGMGVASIFLSAATAFVAAPIAGMAGQMMEGIWTGLSAVGRTLGQITLGITDNLISIGQKAIGGVMTLCRQAAEGFQSAGNWLKNTLNPWISTEFAPKALLGDAVRNYLGGMITSGISNYAMEQISKSDNWLSKLGIGLAAAITLMPVNAFANPAFDMKILNSTAMFATEVFFNTASQVISTETMNALENKYGEQWYSNMLQMTVSSVIGAGLDGTRQYMQNEIAIREIHYENINAELNKLRDKYQGAVESEKTLSDGTKQITLIDINTGNKAVFTYNATTMNIVETDAGKITKTEITKGINSYTSTKVECLDNGNTRVTSEDGTVTLYDANYQILEITESELSYDAGQFIDYTTVYDPNTGKIVDLKVDGDNYAFSEMFGSSWDSMMDATGRVSLIESAKLAISKGVEVKINDKVILTEDGMIAEINRLAGEDYELTINGVSVKPEDVFNNSYESAESILTSEGYLSPANYKIGYVSFNAGGINEAIFDSSFDVMQSYLDWAGVVPGVGDTIDAINGLIYLSRGKRDEAALSLLAVGTVVPLNAIKAAGNGLKSYRNIGKDITVLGSNYGIWINSGKYKYIEVAKRINANYFCIPDKIWKKFVKIMNEDELWEMNRKFLDRAMLKTRAFYVTTPYALAGKYLRKEIDYLLSKEYKIVMREGKNYFWLIK
ncbi:MAG: discoidin domain-containing protein [Candidatus Omnitrophica bacterium]|nr:discoidin domain-containing protein [Candidatus Omnitrophota bacterium]